MVMCTLCKKSRVVRRVEWHQSWQHERAQKRVAFIANPCKFTKELLGQQHSGKLACSQEEIKQHLCQKNSNPEREQELGDSSLPKILWALLVYTVPLSTVGTLERKVSNHLRRWLGLPKSLSSIAFTGQNNCLSKAVQGQIQGN